MLLQIVATAKKKQKMIRAMKINSEVQILARTGNSPCWSDRLS